MYAAYALLALRSRILRIIPKSDLSVEIIAKDPKSALVTKGVSPLNTVALALKDSAPEFDAKTLPSGSASRDCTLGAQSPQARATLKRRSP